MASFKVVRINCNGLRSKLKRRSLFQFLKKQKFHIICLQETFILESDFEVWKKEWNSTIHYVPGTNHSKGQVILFGKGFEASHIMVQTETDRILAVSFVLNNEDFVLVNIYGPNNEANKSSFFQDLEEVIESFPPTYNILVAGDFNVVLDNNLDIIAGGQHNDQYVKRFNEFLRKADLYDAWRIFHGQEKQFSWSSNSSPWKARRLDYVLVNSVLFNKVIASEMFPVPNTDHCGVEIELHLHAIKRGPSYWKFNKSLLKYHDY